MPRPTLLPLDNFRKELGYNPWFFWQLSNSDKMPLNSNCNALVREYAWQNADSVGRFEILEALAQAEVRLTEVLGYSPALAWNTDVWDVGCITHWYRYSSSYGSGYGLSAMPNTIRLSKGYVKQIGTPSYVPVTNAAVSYFDRDGDGLKETFELTFTNSLITDLKSVRAYFASADQLPFVDTDLQAYSVRPIIVTRPDAATIKIVGPAWLLVKPGKYQGRGIMANNLDGPIGLNSSGAIDPADPTAFVTTLDIYQEVVKLANQITLTYDQGGNLTPYQLTANVLNSKLGRIVTAGMVGNVCTCTPGPNGQPCAGPTVAHATISYQAGDDLANWQTTLVRYAVAEIMRPISACGEANREVARWQQNMASISSQMQEQFKVSQDVLDNPLGQNAGHIGAWQRVQQLRLVASAVV